MNRVCAILIADMCGFSHACEADIDAAIRSAQRFWRIGEAEVEAAGGQFVKGWADNFAAVFPTVAQALACAAEVTRLVHSSVGIGWGAVVLDRPVGDLWGVEVNRASKLGEDIAGLGEILLTEAAKLQAS